MSFQMGRVLAPALFAAALTVTVGRLFGAFFGRFNLLSRTGALARVRERERGDRRTRALRDAGVEPPTVQVGAAGRAAADADDVDDLGLLARAMRSGVVTYVDERLPRRGASLKRAPEFPAELFETEALPEQPVPVVATLLVLLATVLAVPALVRPLEAWAPWCIGAALVLGAASWVLAHRSRNR